MRVIDDGIRDVDMEVVSKRAVGELTRLDKESKLLYLAPATNPAAYGMPLRPMW